MKILAIRFARLGDVVLLCPALSLLKRSFSNVQLTLLTGHRCAPIAELCPAIDEVIAVDRLSMRDGSVFTTFRDMVRLVRDVRRRQFELVIDFHSFRETNLLAWWSGATVRIGMKRYRSPYLSFCFNRPPVLEDKSLHVAEMFERVVGETIPLLAEEGKIAWSDRPDFASEPTTPAPSLGLRPIGLALRGATPPVRGGELCIPEELRRWADLIGPNKRRLALYVDAPVSERIWAPERFAAVADFAIERLGVMPIVISSSHGRTLAARVQKASRNPDRIAVFTDVSLPHLAALIASACLLVSNDTGPMHIGPAVGVHTLGLFSVGYPEHFRPVGPNNRFLRANPIEKIETKDVIAVVDEMWATVDPGFRC